MKTRPPSALSRCLAALRGWLPPSRLGWLPWPPRSHLRPWASILPPSSGPARCRPVRLELDCLEERSLFDDPLGLVPLPLLGGAGLACLCASPLTPMQALVAGWSQPGVGGLPACPRSQGSTTGGTGLALGVAGSELGVADVLDDLVLPRSAVALAGAGAGQVPAAPAPAQPGQPASPASALPGSLMPDNPLDDSEPTDDLTQPDTQEPVPPVAVDDGGGGGGSPGMPATPVDPAAAAGGGASAGSGGSSAQNAPPAAGGAAAAPAPAPGPGVASAAVAPAATPTSAAASPAPTATAAAASAPAGAPNYSMPMATVGSASRQLRISCGESMPRRDG